MISYLLTEVRQCELCGGTGYACEIDGCVLPVTSLWHACPDCHIKGYIVTDSVIEIHDGPVAIVDGQVRRLEFAGVYDDPADSTVVYDGDRDDYEGLLPLYSIDLGVES